MWKYVLERCIWMIAVSLGVAFIIFSILYFIPGTPAERLLPDGATRAEVREMEILLGLDKPYIVQLWNFLYGVFVKLDFGMSWTFRIPVTTELFSRLPRTMLMGIAAISISALVGIPLGITAAKNHGKWRDYGLLGLSMLFVSLPQFWVALQSVIIFSKELKWLPAYGIGGIQYYILPIIGWVLSGIATNARQTRSSMLEVIRSDFVTTARAKGQSEKVITRKHMLPNALMPVITIIGGNLAFTIAGMAITERIFAVPGVGLLMLTAVNGRDYPTIRGCTIFFSVFCAAVYLLVDLIYAWLDPRIKAQYQSGGARRRARA